MTTATTEGRRLVLSVEGIDAPFYVDPLSGKRGHYLTQEFVGAMLGKRTPAGGEAIFIECFGAANYARMTGSHVDQFTDAGEYVQTFSPEGEVSKVEGDPPPALAFPNRDDLFARYTHRDANPDWGEVEGDGEPIRQEECESLTLCALYWQTVVGMEAVRVFLSSGEGTTGSLKALALLTARLGLSQSETSLNSALGNPTQEGDIPATATRSGGGISVRLPADRRGPLGLKPPSKGRKARNR